MYNILIVDDEKIERSGIRMLLKRMGIELGVFEACNGKQALEYLTSDKNTGIGHIDILLTDVKMPFMDGIELIKNVMHNDISLKTIIFSGYNEFEYAKLAVKLGVKDYILKPVDPSEFSSTITGVITELDEQHKKDEDYNRQANFIKQYYMYTLLNSGDASGILDNGDFLAGYNRLALIEFNTDFFGKYDTGEDIFKEITGELDYQYLNLNPLQSVIIFSDKSLTADGNIDKNIEEMFTNIHDYIYRKTGQFMYIAVSGLFNDYHELPQVMDAVDTLMNNKFYETGRYIFSDNISEDTPVLVQIDDDALMKQMKQDIKPNPIFYGEGNRYFGIELEIDGAGRDDDFAEELLDIANARAELLYIKTDGSLDDGMELVSHPCTMNYHINEFPWEDIMHRAVRQGYRSHQTSTCGLHLHVNRNAFSDSQEGQDEVISRILYFVEHHWNELLKFSRRSEYTMNRWAARYGYEHTPKAIMDKAKKGGNGRYAAVNLCNYHTVEFRLFRGTLKYNTFIATIQLVNRICDVAMYNTDDSIAKLSWSDFVADVTEPELIQYLKERQLYVNEEVCAEEEM